MYCQLVVPVQSSPECVQCVTRNQKLYRYRILFCTVSISLLKETFLMIVLSPTLHICHWIMNPENCHTYYTCVVLPRPFDIVVNTLKVYILGSNNILQIRYRVYCFLELCEIQILTIMLHMYSLLNYGFVNVFDIFVFCIVLFLLVKLCSCTVMPI